MTETLARIYLEQKNYEKAIQSYKILSLKYPEKSSFFADQIKAVQRITGAKYYIIMTKFTIFLILIVLVAFLLVVVIMVQNPKGGGLSSSFGGGGTQQLGGVKKTTDFLDKSTWALATVLIALILFSNVTIQGSGSAEDSKALDATENTATSSYYTKSMITLQRTE